MEGSTLKGTKPTSSKVNEKMIYLNCSESLQTDLVSATSPQVYLLPQSNGTECYWSSNLHDTKLQVVPVAPPKKPCVQKTHCCQQNL